MALRLRIPAKPNSIPGRPEHPSERSDAGLLIVREVSGLVKRTAGPVGGPERSGGSGDKLGRGGRGEGRGGKGEAEAGAEAEAGGGGKERTPPPPRLSALESPGGVSRRPY